MEGFTDCSEAAARFASQRPSRAAVPHSSKVHSTRVGMPSCNCKSACSGARCACAKSGAMCDAGCSCSATVCHNRVSGCGVLCTMACLLRALKVCVRVRVCGLVVAWMCAVVFQCFCVCSVPISASVYVRARLLAGAVMHVMSVCVCIGGAYVGFLTVPRPWD